MIDYTCPRCGEEMQSQDEKAGMTETCSYCNREVDVPIITTCPACSTSHIVPGKRQPKTKTPRQLFVGHPTIMQYAFLVLGGLGLILILMSFVSDSYDSSLDFLMGAVLAIFSLTIAAILSIGSRIWGELLRIRVLLQRAEERKKGGESK
jgi:DNA-directed RNA polymerase subunit RPC12/RpoP